MVVVATFRGSTTRLRLLRDDGTEILAEIASHRSADLSAGRGFDLAARPAGAARDVTAGYSLTPQAKKLGLKPELRVALHDAPAGWELVDPPDVQYVHGDEPAEVIISFVRAEADLVDRVAALGRRIFPDGALWFAWPRRAAGHVSDVTENAIRAAVLPLGLVDVKVAAIDDDWSGLKIVWRRENRPAKKP